MRVDVITLESPTDNWRNLNVHTAAKGTGQGNIRVDPADGAQPNQHMGKWPDPVDGCGQTRSKQCGVKAAVHRAAAETQRHGTKGKYRSSVISAAIGNDPQEWKHLPFKRGFPSVQILPLGRAGTSALINE